MLLLCCWRNWLSCRISHILDMVNWILLVPFNMFFVYCIFFFTSVDIPKNSMFLELVNKSVLWCSTFGKCCIFLYTNELRFTNKDLRSPKMRKCLILLNCAFLLGFVVVVVVVVVYLLYTHELESWFTHADKHWSRSEWSLNSMILHGARHCRCS